MAKGRRPSLPFCKAERERAGHEIFDERGKQSKIPEPKQTSLLSLISFTVIKRHTWMLKQYLKVSKRDLKLQLEEGLQTMFKYYSCQKKKEGTLPANPAKSLTCIVQPPCVPSYRRHAQVQLISEATSILSFLAHKKLDSGMKLKQNYFVWRCLTKRKAEDAPLWVFPFCSFQDQVLLYQWGAKTRLV